MVDTPENADQDSDELRKRRERLAALKSKRVAAEGAPLPDPQDGGSEAEMAGVSMPAGLGGPFGGGEAGAGQKRARQRKMLMKVYKVLTQTPEDENGTVPDTPFTESGVARLMSLLRERSADPSQPGAKIADGLLNFISPNEGESATSSGASVEKLQMLARRAESMRGKGGGGAGPGLW